MEEEVKTLPIEQPEAELPAPSFWGKLKANKFKILSGVLGIFVFAGAVFGAYKLGQRQIQPTPQPTPTPAVVATPTPDPTTDWKAYTSISYGYSIKYPDEYSPKDLGNGTLAFFEILDGEEVQKVTIYRDFRGGWACTKVISSEEIVVGGERSNLEVHADLIKETCIEVDPKGEHKGVVSIERDGIIWLFLLSIDRSRETEELATFKNMLSTFRFLEEEVETGTVTGRLCYPSEFLPKGRILAKNLTSGKVYAQEYPGSSAGGVSSYSFELPSGKYILKYLTRETGTSGYSGYYSTCSKYLDIGDCKDYESWEPLPVEIIAGQTTEGIDLCDFYYVIPEREPEF